MEADEVREAIVKGLAEISQEIADHQATLSRDPKAFDPGGAYTFVSSRLDELRASGGQLGETLSLRIGDGTIDFESAQDLLEMASKVAGDLTDLSESIDRARAKNLQEASGDRWPGCWSREATDIVHQFGAAQMGPILHQLKMLEGKLPWDKCKRGLRRYCVEGELRYGVKAFVSDPRRWCSEQRGGDGCKVEAGQYPDDVASRIDLRRDVAASFPQLPGERAVNGVARVQRIMELIDAAHAANPKHPGESGGDYVRRLLAAAGIPDDPGQTQENA